MALTWTNAFHSYYHTRIYFLGWPAKSWKGAKTETTFNSGINSHISTIFPRYGWDNNCNIQTVKTRDQFVLNMKYFRANQPDSPHQYYIADAGQISLVQPTLCSYFALYELANYNQSDSHFQIIYNEHPSGVDSLSKIFLNFNWY